MSDASEGRSGRHRVVLVVFRMTMVVVIVLFAWRTYEEMAIADARASGNLEPADAVVVNRTEEHGKTHGGTGQDRTADWVYWDRVTLELRVNGKLQSVEGGDVHDVGDHVQVDLWHGHVIQLDGYYVWRGWHSGLGGNVLIVFYPLAMGYLISLAVAARVRMARRGGGDVPDPGDFAFVFETLFGIVVGAFTIVPLALVPAALGADHPRFWPLIPVATGTTAALFFVRRTLRHRQSADACTGAGAGAGDTDAEGAPAQH
ncbi:hypothetical protein HLK59_15365 [Streptomyces sp. S3(2020)]|uniref:hypothetical protein n=1 Tax=Streptomyces sp. S3(2020) TaxID=2732044 RepID=UPI001489655D|nr:hypothetical protein [Streptomyces sp. S3(2020)]NNN31723.1 hypothetical protein [Streptomyces sp. S3(2020)]